MDEQIVDEGRAGRKAQMEIVGLVIIIVLLTLGFLFFLRFSLSKEPEDVRGFFSQTRIAVNTPNTLLATTVHECSKKSVQNLLVDCATSRITSCSTGENSCEASYRVMDDILRSSLGSSGMGYELTAFIKSEESEPLEFNGRKMRLNYTRCAGERETEAFPIRLYPDPRTLVVRMDVC